MLNTLRTINWPGDIYPSGGVLKGELLAQVSDYETLINIAKNKSECLRIEQENKMNQEAELLRVQVAQSVMSDFDKFQKVFNQQRDHILEKSAEICTEVTKVALSDLLGSLDDTTKIKHMLRLLIERMHYRIDIEFVAHPNKLDTVKSVLQNQFSTILRVGSYVVSEDATLDPDQLRIKTPNSAYIDISIKNIIAAVSAELESIQSLMQEELSASSMLSGNFTDSKITQKNNGLVEVNL